MDDFAALSPDLVFISHGHNEGHAVHAEPYWRDDLLALTETVSLLSPASEIALIAQNPRTADDSMDARQYVTRSVAQMRGYGFINVWRAFQDASPAGRVVEEPADGALIDADGVHPNTAGERVWTDAVERQMVLVPGAVPSQPAVLAGDSGAESAAGWRLRVPDRLRAVRLDGARRHARQGHEAL